MAIDSMESEFLLSRDGDLWAATHMESGAASQGSTPSEAVGMAEEAVELSQQDHTPGDEAFQRAMLKRFGIDIEDELVTPHASNLNAP